MRNSSSCSIYSIILFVPSLSWFFSPRPRYQKVLWMDTNLRFFLSVVHRDSKAALELQLLAQEEGIILQKNFQKKLEAFLKSTHSNSFWPKVLFVYIILFFKELWIVSLFLPALRALRYVLSKRKKQNNQYILLAAYLSSYERRKRSLI